MAGLSSTADSASATHLRSTPSSSGPCAPTAFHRSSSPSSSTARMWAEEVPPASRAIEATAVYHAADGTYAAGGATAPGGKLLNQDRLILDVVPAPPGGARASAAGPPVVDVLGCVDGHGELGGNVATLVTNVRHISRATTFLPPRLSS